MAPKYILITGANRGLGLGLAREFVRRDENVVVAAVRDPSKFDLGIFNKGTNSDVIPVSYDASVESSSAQLVAQLQSRGIGHLDIVIANAGIAESYPTVSTVRRADIIKHVEVNAIGPVLLYQATRELLRKAPGTPILALMGSKAGCISNQFSIPNAAYGPTKTMLHWFAARINAEDEWLNTLALDPGWVQTDMGNHGARTFGMQAASTTVEESVTGMYRLLTGSTKEEHGGKLVEFTGQVQAW